MSAAKTSEQFKVAAAACRRIFEMKATDYGTSWRMLRLSSLADQIFIKAQRIRTIDHLKTKRVNEELDSEFIGIVNYSIIALIRLDLGESIENEIPLSSLLLRYDEKMNMAWQLLENKNHDYGEAWREMKLSSFTDIILMRLLRIRQLEEKEISTVSSEGVDANLLDIINYSIFALIQISERNS